jgi:hypothetical protein
MSRRGLIAGKTTESVFPGGLEGKSMYKGIHVGPPFVLSLLLSYHTPSEFAKAICNLPPKLFAGLI